MDQRLIKASQRLSELEVRVDIDGWSVEVYWFRAMMKKDHWFIRRHAHRSFEFHFAARGDCLLILDDGVHPVPEGSFFITPPGVYHEQRNGGSAEFVEYSLNCALVSTRFDAPEPVDGIAGLRNLFLQTICGPQSDTYGAIGLFDRALEEADRRSPFYKLEIQSLILRILVSCARSIGPVGPTAVLQDPLGNPQDRMAKILGFIEDNIGQRITPDDIADFMNLSTKQVGRIITGYKGYSTQRFITTVKLRRAKHLLVSTDLPIRLIALQLGFSNEYYFNSVFRLHEGFPPGVFRESMHGQSVLHS